LARPELSERERQVLEYIANGRSNKEIGQMLYISEHTVKTHVKSILTKLDAMGRTEAIAVGIKRGLIKPLAEGVRGEITPVGSDSKAFAKRACPQ